MNDVIASTQRLLDRVERGEGAAGVLTSDASTASARRFVAAMDKLARMSEQPGSADEGLVPALLFDPKYKNVLEDLKVVAHNFRDVSDRLVGGKGTLGGLIKDEPADASIRQASRDLQAALANLREITAKINEGEGTLGALIADPTVYERLVTILEGAQRKLPAPRPAQEPRRRRQAEGGRVSPRATSVYRCQECGFASPKPGTCPDCLRGGGAYVQLVEERSGARTASRRPGAPSSSRPQPLKDVVLEAGDRVPTGIGELDRVLGGGVVRGSLVLLGGEPGCGKCVTGDTRVFDPETGDLPSDHGATRSPSIGALHQREFAASSPIVRSGLSRARHPSSHRCHYAVGAEAALHTGPSSPH